MEGVWKWSSFRYVTIDHGAGQFLQSSDTIMPDKFRVGD